MNPIEPFWVAWAIHPLFAIGWFAFTAYVSAKFGMYMHRETKAALRDTGEPGYSTSDGYKFDVEDLE